MAAPKLVPHDEPAQPPVVADAAEAVRRAAQGERVTVAGDDARPLAVVVPLADLRRLQEDDRRRAEAIEAIRVFGKAFEHLDPDEVEREAVKAVREVRAEMYAERMARGE